VHIGGRRESPSVGRGVLCARRGKGIRCGSRLLAELSPASVGNSNPAWEREKRGGAARVLDSRAPAFKDRWPRSSHTDGVSHVLGVGRFGERFGRSRLLKGNPHSLGLGRARNAGICILSSESQRGVAHTSKVRA
jgi:hypothetical protein